MSPFIPPQRTIRFIAGSFFGALMISFGAISNPAHPVKPEQALLEINPVVVDSQAHGYATFQSHNQKVLANSKGVFMTHLRTRNPSYTAQQWRLSFSDDNGQHFSTLYEETNATNPPVIESDSEGNLYLIRADFVDGNAFLYRFLASESYRHPTQTLIPNGAAGKYAMAIDEERNRIYFFAHNNTFHILGFDGTVQRSVHLLKPGDQAILQYPLLFPSPTGELYAAWTTQKHDVYLYWDIHRIQSADGGLTWNTPLGNALHPPLPADDPGIGTWVIKDDEYQVHTWLSSFAVTQNKVHYLYLAQTLRLGWNNGWRRNHHLLYADSGTTSCDTAPAATPCLLMHQIRRPPLYSCNCDPQAPTVQR